MRTHRAAFGNDPVLAASLDAGGEYALAHPRRSAMWTPESISKLQHATRAQQLQHLQRNTRR